MEKLGPWFERHKAKFPVYIPLGLLGWYIYGMFLNSIRLGTAATFHTEGEEVGSIWVFTPLRNWLVLFTPFGLGTTIVILLLICLITKKGYIWFSGYKFIHDPRGFDILPDATHGSSGFLTKKELEEFLELGSVTEVKGMMLGKYKKRAKARTNMPPMWPTGWCPGTTTICCASERQAAENPGALSSPSCWAVPSGGNRYL